MNSSASHIFALATARTLVANFAAITFTITPSASPTGGGARYSWYLLQRPIGLVKTAFSHRVINTATMNARVTLIPML